MNPGDSAAQSQPGARAPAAAQARAQTLVVVDHNRDEARHLARQLSYFGYTVHTHETIAGLAELVREVRPAALILDLPIPEDGGPGGPGIAPILKGPAPPIIFLSRRADLAARVYAVRAGGSAYLVRPVDTDDLVSALDRLTNVVPPPRYRVLIVDDSAVLARASAVILQAAGMDVVTITDPGALLDTLAEQQPDLVLLDMYMPGYEGPELAAVIRQQAAFHGMPIVFLSGETDRDRQLVAMGQGGDDFLAKPVAPAHLVAAVRSRIERARTIRGELNRDSLTGLLTHTALKDQLAREVARARRYGTGLSVVMLDVDHFKRVNDTYGHAAGDRVLKSLARLLRQHLRASDIVGRYGGEEFAVLLPEADGAAAVAVIDRIRARFAGVQHQSAAEAAFTTTFSAGVATIPPHAAADSLLEQADAALYAAKQGGRNRVARAEDPQGAVGDQR